MKSDPQLRVRLPADVKAFVQGQAERDASSQNSVVVRALRALMDGENANRPGASTPDRSEVTVDRG